MLILCFLLGIANFALYRAVLASEHPLVMQMTGATHAALGRLAMALEFLLLLLALLLASHGQAWAAWAYAGYSLCNAVCAWLILTGRV